MSRTGAYYSDQHSLYHNQCQAMGTRFDVILHGQSGELAEGVFNSMVSELLMN